MGATALEIRTELVTVRSADGTPLDGVHYTRAGDARPPAARAVVNFLHGRTMTFYVGVQRFAAADLVAAGYDVLAVNRRGAGIAGIRDSFESHGDAWTLWAQHRMDVDAAVAYLRGGGYRRIVMAGHSQGGLLAADHAAGDPDVAGLVLASPGFAFTGLPTAFPDGYRGEVIERARAMVARGEGRGLILLPMWPWIMSAEAVADAQRPGAATPLDELLARYGGPLLVFCGDQGLDETLLAGARKAFGRSPSPAKRLDVLPGCDHFYVGHEARVTALMTAWLAGHVAPAEHARRPAMGA